MDRKQDNLSQNLGATPESVTPQREVIMLGEDLAPWHERIEKLIQEGAHIVVLRGAGSVNGIEHQAAEIAVEIIKGHIDSVIEQDVPAAILFDGDPNNREQPDVGMIFGALADSYASDERVAKIAVQSQSWYQPNNEHGQITSANGTAYETYVFSDSLQGGHDTLSQSERLVNYDNYGVVFVGPVGPIALSQLHDLSEKALCKVPVICIKTANNRQMDSIFQDQLAAETDEQKIERIKAKLAQREQKPFGELFTKDGVLNLDENELPGVDLSVIDLHKKIDLARGTVGGWYADDYHYRGTQRTQEDFEREVRRYVHTLLSQF